MSDEIKELSEITRKEWVGYRWQEIEPTFGDETDERMFIKSGLRTPDEAAQAAVDWDCTAEERGFNQKENNDGNL